MFWSSTHSRRGATVTKQQSLGGGQSYRHGDPHSLGPSFFGWSRPSRALPATKIRHQQSKTWRTQSISNTGHFYTPTWPGVWLLLAEVHVMRTQRVARRCKITEPLRHGYCKREKQWLLSDLKLYIVYLQQNCNITTCHVSVPLTSILYVGEEQWKLMSNRIVKMSDCRHWVLWKC